MHNQAYGPHTCALSKFSIVSRHAPKPGGNQQVQQNMSAALLVVVGVIRQFAHPTEQKVRVKKKGFT